MKKCDKCKKEVIKCDYCDNDFKSDDEIGCVKTDFFGDGKKVYYNHMCRKCYDEWNRKYK